MPAASHAKYAALALLIMLVIEPTWASAQKVHVELYAESLCPYCAQFMFEKLGPMFKNGVDQLVWIDYIAYGNAHWDPEKAQPDCQHGPKECRFNRMLSCAMAAYPMQADWFPFVECLEHYAQKQDDVVNGTQACAVHAGLLTNRLVDCYNGALGDTLQRLSKERTASLQPPHQFVPWVVVNGIPLGDDFDNVQTYICAAFSDVRSRPKACLDVPVAPSVQRKYRYSSKQQAQAPATGLVRPQARTSTA